jgi:hypothetical protein
MDSAVIYHIFREKEAASQGGFHGVHNQELVQGRGISEADDGPGRKV